MKLTLTLYIKNHTHGGLLDWLTRSKAESFLNDHLQTAEERELGAAQCKSQDIKALAEGSSGVAPIRG